MPQYETVVGLEIHAELKTRTKMFCGCINDPFGAAEPNIYLCPVCLGLPGTLPVMNRQAVEWTVLVGLALGCEIGYLEDSRQKTKDRGSVRSPSSARRFTKWDRKNYFYPDLPKGYQISQYDLPICHKGTLRISSKEFGEKGIEITRIHLEEDTGKLIHPVGANYSLIDYNRAGVPLMELVTEPVIRSGLEAAAFATEYQLVLRTLGISDADMEKGQMRVEANISVRPFGTKEFGTKVEVKNLNSIRSVRQAIVYETERQTQALEAGQKLIQETRGWNESKQETFSQRLKETAADYRYFPDPDLPPVTFDRRHLSAGEAGKTEYSRHNGASEAGIDVQALRRQLPELPWEKRTRYVRQYLLSEQVAERLTADLAMSRYFDEVVAADDLNSVMIANWILNELPNQTILAPYLRELGQLVTSGEVTTKLAKELLHKIRTQGKSPRVIIKEEGLAVVADEATIDAYIHQVLITNTQAVADWRAGKEQALGFLVGQVLAKSRGQADPLTVRQRLQEILRKE